MDDVFSVLELLTKAFAALKAYLDLMRLRQEKSDHLDARKHRTSASEGMSMKRGPGVAAP